MMGLFSHLVDFICTSNLPQPLFPPKFLMFHISYGLCMARTGAGEISAFMSKFKHAAIQN
jgi:hypothetical protein